MHDSQQLVLIWRNRGEQVEGVERPVEDPGFAGVEGYVASGEGEYVRGVEGAGEEGRVFVA